MLRSVRAVKFSPVTVTILKTAVGLYNCQSKGRTNVRDKITETRVKRRREKEKDGAETEEVSVGAGLVTQTPCVSGPCCLCYNTNGITVLLWRHLFIYTHPRDGHRMNYNPCAFYDIAS